MVSIRAIACVSALAIMGCVPLAAQSSATEIALTIAAGRPLDVRIDERVTITHVGQRVTGVLVEPLYAYDRIVVPAGTKAIGHVAAIDALSTATRIRAILSGDLTPARHVVLQFDAFVLASGESIPINATVTHEIPHPTHASAPESSASTDGARGRLRHETVDRAKGAIADAKQRGRDALAQLQQPGKGARLKDAIVARLPYHPQFISAGTGYHAQLSMPIIFDTVTASPLALSETRPAPSSALSARLLTALDSSKTPRGTRLHAVVTEPVFSTAHELIVPEGTLLEGEVTLARPARWFHRNGQLRFLFETIHRSDAASPTPMLASLQSVEASDDDHLTIDEEGGTTLSSPKTRFIAPAIAVLALRGNLDSHEHLDPDGDGHIIRSGHPGALGAGGFLGLGVLGAGLAQVWRPLGIGLSVVGAGRTLYSNILGRGREVQFAADTPMQLQLAPGPSPAP